MGIVTSQQIDRTFDDLRETINDYTAVLKRRWRAGLLALGVITSIAFWFSQYLPRLYSSSTVFERWDDVVLQELIRGNSPYGFGQLRASIVTDITTKPALAAAATRIGLIPEGAITFDGALNNEESKILDKVLYEHRLTLSAHLLNRQSARDNVQLECSANDPKIARDFVIALRDYYIEKTQGHITTVLERTRNYFETELEKKQDAISALSGGTVTNARDFPGVDPTDPVSITRHMVALEKDRNELLSRLDELNADIEAREFMLANGAQLFAEVSVNTIETNTDKPVLNQLSNPAIQRAIEQVESEITDALTSRRMTPEHPAVRALQLKLDTLKQTQKEWVAEQLASLETDTSDKKETFINPRLSPVWIGQKTRAEMELMSLRHKQELVQADLKNATNRADLFASVFDKFLETSGNIHELEADRQEAIHEAGLWRNHLTQIDRVLAAARDERGTQFTIVDEPRERPLPAQPQLSMVTMVSTGCGFAAMIILITIVELLDRSFRSVSQVTRSIGVPVFECIGIIDTPKERRRQLRSRMFWTPALTFAVLAAVTTASLAYMSLRRPDLHQQTMAKIDNAFRSTGASSAELLETE